MVRLSKSISEQLSRPLQDRHRAAALVDLFLLIEIRNRCSMIHETTTTFFNIENAQSGSLPISPATSGRSMGRVPIARLRPAR
jgi:hypothetical protein